MRNVFRTAMVPLSLLASLLLLPAADAFAPCAPATARISLPSAGAAAIGRRRAPVSHPTPPSMNTKTTTKIRAADDDRDVGLPPLPSQGAPPREVPARRSPAEAAPAPDAPAPAGAARAYPVDLPSPVLLGTSMVLAISSIGSLFELAGGAPKIGLAPTAALVAIGLPLSLFLIYAAILKGAAETAEDDEKYNTPRRL